MAVDMNKLIDGNGLLYALKGMLTKINALLDKKVDKVEGKGLSTNDYTAAEKTKLAGIAAGANKYTHPTHTAKTAGLYKVTVDAQGHVTDATAVAKDDITALGIPGQDTNTWTPFKGATSSAAGTAGYVPAPAAGDQEKFFKADGTFAVPKDTTYNPATQSANGLMTAADKKKLDGIAEGANKYTHPAYTAKDAGLYKVTVDATGHVSAATAVAKADITALGIPGKDTTYSPATQSANGLMAAADKKKLDAFGAASTYATTTYVGQQIAAAGHITKSIVTALPEASAAKDNVIYMVKKSDGSGSNLYDEYMLIDGKLELVGDSATKIATLSNADIEEILAQV
ncbi:hypothetical protein [uncultured Gemmiger sp.]|uniref:hypothetical protein n=1 Tax=uncultured Gemmiger sp. TaxID=1623490 RepID=UPI0025F1D0E2|nr:hypothetical protein [uncultured Gemmiger sp.]